MKNRKRLLAILVCILIVSSMVGCGYPSGEESNEAQTTETSANKVSGENEMESEAVAETESDEDVDIIETEEEEIYEELVLDGVSYQAVKSGIYCATSAGRECIYAAYPGLEPNMQIFEDTLYLKTDIEYKEGDLDWVNSGIKWIDLLTLDSGILELGMGSNLTIEDFWIYNGFIEVNQHDMILLSEAGRGIYNGKALEELTEQERTEFGQRLSQQLIDNPGTLMNVSNRRLTENVAWLDLDMDGTVEKITLRPQEDSELWYTVLDCHEILLNDQMMIQGYSSSIHNTIWAVSLDGQEVLIALYEDGPSGDPYTRLFRYEEGTLVEVGAFGADIRECEITEDGIISGTIRRDIIETSFIHMSWQMDEEHRLAEVQKDAYDFVVYDEREDVMLLEDLILRTEPNGSESFGISPQEVRFLQVTGDERWILLETMDGVRGWFEVEDFIIVELDKMSHEVFEGLSFAG